MVRSDRSSSTEQALAAIVLCGGRSQRMGQDKAWVRVGDRTLLQHVVDRVRPVGQTIVVSAARQHLPELPADIRVVADECPEAGPLAGLLSGLNALSLLHGSEPDGPGQPDAVWVTGCDTPLIDERLIRGVASQLGAADVALVQHESHWNPLLAVYHRRVQARLQTLFDHNERSLFRCLQHLNCRVIAADQVARPGQLINVNTPEALQQLQAILDE